MPDTLPTPAFTERELMMRQSAIEASLTISAQADAAAAAAQESAAATASYPDEVTVTRSTVTHDPSGWQDTTTETLGPFRCEFGKPQRQAVANDRGIVEDVSFYPVKFESGASIRPDDTLTKTAGNGAGLVFEVVETNEAQSAPRPFTALVRLAR